MTNLVEPQYPTRAPAQDDDPSSRERTRRDAAGQVEHHDHGVPAHPHPELASSHDDIVDFLYEKYNFTAFLLSDTAAPGQSYKLADQTVITKRLRRIRVQYNWPPVYRIDIAHTPQTAPLRYRDLVMEFMPLVDPEAGDWILYTSPFTEVDGVVTGEFLIHGEMDGWIILPIRFYRGKSMDMLLGLRLPTVVTALPSTPPEGQSAAADTETSDDDSDSTAADE